MNPIMILILPLAVTTLLLAVQARWSWIRTQDKILHGMKLDEVLRRAEFAKTHRLFGGIHSLIAIPSLIISSILGNLWIYPNQTSSLIGVVLFVWLYAVYVPHMLALYLYHLRWNPNTVARKRKLDAEESHYEGDYRLRDSVQYRLGEDGELVEVEDKAEEIAR